MSDFSPSRIRPLPQYLPAEANTVQSFNIPQEHNSEVQLREYIRIIYKYRLVTISLAIGCAILATVYAFLATPQYTAESKISISTYMPVYTSSKIDDVLQETSRDRSYLETQLKELTSMTLADRVLMEDQLRTKLFPKKAEESWFISLFSSNSNKKEELDAVAGYRHPISQINKYLDSISVKPQRGTTLVSIYANSDNAVLSAQLANAHARAYIDQVRASRINQQSSGLKFLKSQADELKEKVADLEREIADYAEEHSIVAVNKDENITAQRMSQLNELLTRVTGERMEVENIYKEAKDAFEKGESAGFDDSSIQSMRSQLASLQAEYGNLGAKFTASYPKMQQLKAQIDNLTKSVESQRNQIIVGLRSKALAAQEKEKSLKEELEQQKSRAFELSKSQVQYNSLNRELESSRELLQNVLRQIKETGLAVESNSSNISIVDSAVIPKNPSYPRKKMFLVGGLFFGIFAGLVLTFLFSYLDNTIRTPDQVASYLKVPALGVVPSFKDSLSLPEALKNKAEEQEPVVDVREENALTVVSETNNLENSPALVYVSAPQSLAAESYRTIRTAILLSQAGQPPRTILVSSAQSSEGKTTSTTNLAATLASSGGRVVIIDADLRRPKVHKHFKIDKNVPGLVDVLTGQKQLEEVILNDPLNRVSIIVCGKIPPNPAELLGSVEMANTLDRLAQMFDYVLIDSPPILPVTDSVILSRYVDGVVLVIKGGSTPRKVVRDAKDRLKNAGANILGTILNNVDVAGGDYYYYNRYYYSYYSEEGTNPDSQAA